MQPPPEPPPTHKASPWFKIALIGFPTGLILFSIIALLIYLNFQEQSKNRSIKYAAGLRQELTAERLQRHTDILTQATTDPQKALLTAGSYVSSTLGAENMGYQTRVLREHESPEVPIAAIDAELTGQQRARDVVLVLGDYADPPSVSIMLGIAHEITGEAPLRTLRLALLRDATVLKLYYEKCLHGSERVSHLILLGSMAKQPDAQLRQTFHLPEAAARIDRPDLDNTVSTPMQKAQVLKQDWLTLAQRL
jgi:hypothetical protein